MGLLSMLLTGACSYEELLTVSGAGAFTFVYHNSYLYVTDEGGSPNWNGILKIYDTSDPSGPVLKSTTSLPNSSGPRKPYVDHATGLLYIPYRNSNVLAIWNVSDPTAPSLVGSVSTTRSPWAVAVIGDAACVVQCNTRSGGFPLTTAEKIDVSNPASPVIVDTVNGFTPGTASSGQDVIVSSGNFILHGVVTGGSSSPYVSVVDPSTFDLIDSITYGASGGSATHVANDEPDGNYIYTFNGNVDSMVTIDISDPSNLSVASTVTPVVNFGSNAQDPILSIPLIDRMYMGKAGGAGLQIYIFDISTRDTPVEVGSISSSGETVTWLAHIENGCAGFAWGQGTGAAIHLIGEPPLS